MAMAIASFLALILLASAEAANKYSDKKNVEGGELERCSHGAMALTGFTRNGHCVDQV